MSEVPAELRYTKSHEWIRIEADDTVTLGISDHAQEALGDLVFVELPEVGAELMAEDTCCVVESVKAASDVYMPVGGEVIEVNEALNDEPEIINNSPYDNGWLIKFKPVADEFDEFMDADDYSAMLDE